MGRRRRRSERRKEEEKVKEIAIHGKKIGPRKKF
jgi:hypothetical protein